MIAIDILYHDNSIAVCVKPVGVLSEDGGMPELLSEALGGRFYCVHRLDRAVGGVMVYARNPKAAAKLSTAFSGNESEKTYLAAVHGKLDEPNGILKDLLFKDSSKNKSYVVKRMRKGVKEAELEYSTASQTDDSSLLLVTLHTGRSHQIRVQFSSRRHPLIGDVKYGSTVKDCPIALFSYRLSLPHPETGEKMTFKALPERIMPWTNYNIPEI